MDKIIVYDFLKIYIFYNFFLKKINNFYNIDLSVYSLAFALKLSRSL